MNHSTRIDLFTGIHKALRAGLFHLTQKAGATDWEDPLDVASLAEDWDAMVELLHSHTAHEDDHIFRLLDGVPSAPLPPDDDHRDLDDLLADLEERFDRLRVSASAGEGLAWYRDLARYLGTTLHHLHEEETEVMEAIWAARTDDELARCRAGFLAETPPSVSRTSIRWMLSALDRPSRLGWLTGLAAAPEPVRAMVVDLADTQVTPDVAAEVRSILGMDVRKDEPCPQEERHASPQLSAT